MSILLDAATKVLVHGVSGSVGRYQLEGMHRYGTRIVGVVSRSPVDVDWASTYSSVTEAQNTARADLLVTYSSGRFVGAIASEAFKAGLSTVVAVAEDVPMRDVVAAREIARHVGGRLIGPNTNGIMTPGVARVGFFSPEFGIPGNVGVISRSGTLSYGALIQLNRAGIGQSTIVGIGGGIARGTTAADLLRLFDADPATHAIVFLGESGSHEEESVADAVREGMHKPVVALLASGGEQGLGHAGAVVIDANGDVMSKRRMLDDAGVRTVTHLGELKDAVVQTITTEVMRR